MKNKGQELWRKAKTLIPGGNQLLSKRAELFAPEQWPAYYSKAKGVSVWDLDGTEYLDMLNMSAGSCMLGYADPDVNVAVIDAVKRGTMSTLNCPQEVELAELLLELHPWARMVRYARTGGESMAIAARIARAYTGRDTIAFCGYHGWADWYLATNLATKEGLADHLLAGLEPKGVPKGLAGTILPFHYNKIEELEKIVAQNPRLAVGGAHLVLGVEPDMAIFAKGMSNGFPMAAVIGKREVMQAAQDTFISSTFWTEGIGPAATLASIKKMQKYDVPEHLSRIGALMKEVWLKAGEKHGLNVTCSEVLPLLFFGLPGPDPLAQKTLLTQEMLKRGILASTNFYASYAHNDTHVARYAAALDEVFALIAKAAAEGTTEKLLEGPVAHAGFQRLN